MKKLAVLMGLIILASISFSQSTVYEVRMSQTMVTTNTQNQDICENTLDTIKTCGYEQVGVILGITKESKKCKDFYSKCDEEITTTCNSLEQAYNPKEPNYFIGLFCDLYSDAKESNTQVHIQVEQDTVTGINRSLQKIREHDNTKFLSLPR